jgi:hypothetical protein
VTDRRKEGRTVALLYPFATSLARDNFGIGLFFYFFQLSFPVHPYPTNNSQDNQLKKDKKTQTHENWLTNILYKYDKPGDFSPF